jgi:addiction module HigA family antidote
MPTQNTVTDGRKRRPSHPGDILRSHYMDERKITVTALSRAVGISRKHMSDIVNGRARLEPKAAARLARVLGTTTALWVNLQAAVDAWDAEQEARKWKSSHPLPTAAE